MSYLQLVRFEIPSHAMLLLFAHFLFTHSVAVLKLTEVVFVTPLTVVSVLTIPLFVGIEKTTVEPFGGVQAFPLEFVQPSGQVLKVGGNVSLADWNRINNPTPIRHTINNKTANPVT